MNKPEFKTGTVLIDTIGECSSMDGAYIYANTLVDQPVKFFVPNGKLRWGTYCGFVRIKIEYVEKAEAIKIIDEWKKQNPNKDVRMESGKVTLIFDLDTRFEIKMGNMRIDERGGMLVFSAESRDILSDIYKVSCYISEINTQNLNRKLIDITRLDGERTQLIELGILIQMDGMVLDVPYATSYISTTKFGFELFVNKPTQEEEDRIS